jgi:hypothetical protein
MRSSLNGMYLEWHAPGVIIASPIYLYALLLAGGAVPLTSSALSWPSELVSLALNTAS